MSSRSASREEKDKSMLETNFDANLREELRALVAEIAEKDEIPDGATFKGLGIDSMMGVEIVAAVERRYQVKIEDDELAGFTDLDAAYLLVVRKLESKAGASAAE
jgi:acyl carrier protein